MKVVAPGPFYIFQADLLVLDKYARYNKGNTYILSVIDVFSKVAYSVPLKKKDGVSVRKGLQYILEQKFRKNPKYLQVDEGKEFFNSQVKDFLSKMNITMHHNQSDTKSCIIERFQRTLMNKIVKYMDYHHTKSYIPVLEVIITSYNDSFHRSIKKSPNDVCAENEMETFLEIHKNSIKADKDSPVFKIGDYVRIRLKRSTFLKDTLLIF